MVLLLLLLSYLDYFVILSRFYAHILVSELGLKDSSTCATYEKITCDINELIEKDSRKLMNLSIFP